MKNNNKQDTRYKLILVLIFVILSAGIIGAGYGYYHNYATNYRSQVENQLSSIVELKSGELVRWRQERMGDAGFFYKNPAFSSLVQRYFDNANDVEAEGQLRTWLGHTLGICPYERVMLLDTGYAKKMVVPAGPERPDSFISQGTSVILQSGQVAFEDFYYNEVNQKIYLKVMVPILDRDDDRHVIGFLALRIDPDTYLYPMIQSWPTPTTTAETLIVRRDGNDVLFLNELKFQKDSALKLRVPLEKMELPAVKGASGYEGIMEGRDHRGVEVIAAVRSVPASPWILVARMDTAEVYAPLTQMLWAMVVLTGALLIGAGAGVGLVWRTQSQHFYRERVEAVEARALLQVREERSREAAAQWQATFDSVSDLVSIQDIDFTLVRVNKAYADAMKTRPDDLIGKHCYEVVHGTTCPADNCPHEQTMKTKKAVTEELFEPHLDAFLEVSTSPIFNVAGEMTGTVHLVKDITERKKAEENVARINQQNELILNSAAEGILGLDLQGNQTFVNPAAARMLSYEAEELLGRPSHSTWHHTKPDGSPYPREECTIYAACRDGVVHRSSTEVFWRKDGTSFPVEYASTPIYEKGRLAGAVVTFTDITERKRVQDLLLTSEGRYRSVVENANEVIIVAQDGMIKFANRRVEELSGYSSEELLSVAFIEFIHPDDRQLLVESDFQRLSGDKLVAAYPIRMIDKRGQVIWMEISVVVIDWEGRRATLNFMSDITERRRSEEALRDSEAKYSAVVNGSLDGIIIAQGRYLQYANPAILNMIGYGEQELMGIPFLELVHPDDREAVGQNYIKRLSGEKSTAVFEARLICKDGSIVDVEISGTLIQYKDQPADLAILRDITERKKTQDALRESEERYRTLVERALEAVIVIQDGLIRYANPRAYEIMDFPREQNDPMPFMDFIHPQDRAMVIDRHLRRLKGQEFEAVYPIRLADNQGNTRWVQISTAVISWEGKPATLTFLADISENKRVERVLEIQRDLGMKLSQADDLNQALRMCLEAAIEISGMDSGGIYLIDSVTGELHLAYSSGLSQKFTDSVSHYPKSSPSTLLVAAGKPVYSQHLQLGVPISDERKSEGLKAIAVVPVSSGNRVIGALNIASHSAEDIPVSSHSAIETIASQIGGAIDRMQARDALKESEENYRNLVELLHEGIWAIDEDARTTYVNAHMAEMLVYTVEEMQGKELFYFMDEQGREIAAQNLERRREGISETHDFEFLRKDGLRIYTRLATAPITDKDGKYKGAIAGVQDITDRKRLEEEQQRVEKLESVGVLAGGIAHDFNNILTAILGNISLAMMEAAPGSEMHESLEQAEKASLRAKDLTQQLLTFSKGGAPVKKLTSLRELLRDTAGFALRGSNVKCQFSIPADLWHAEIDAGQVSQVIHNLVINARQAMPTGGTIELTAENIALSETQRLGRGLPLKGGNYIRIAITDHGNGIAAEHLDKIFEPFFTTKQKGSGLGLATSFSIARNHGGHLSVESVMGRGSTFYVYLPASESRAVRRKEEKEETHPGGKARILIMDDEKGVREVAGRMLKHIGYEDIEFAADGAEAVKLYKAAMESGKPFSVVILDLTIPGGIGGRATIKQLLKVDPGVKAIVSSGYADESVMAEYKGYGFSGMAAKPYSIEQLRKALHDVIS